MPTKLQFAFTNALPFKTNGLVFSLQLSTGLNGHIQVLTKLTGWATLTNCVSETRRHHRGGAVKGSVLSIDTIFRAVVQYNKLAGIIQKPLRETGAAQRRQCKTIVA